MGKPAARIGDMHVCPMATPGLPPIPHVGGPIIGPGCPTVLIGGMPAAVLGDMCMCVGPPDTVVLGSTGVLFGGKPAARMGDQCGHGGTITLGCPTVLVGETSSGGGGGGSALGSAAAGTVMQGFVSGKNPSPTKGSSSAKAFDKKQVKTDSIACIVKDSDGNPVAGIDYEVQLPSGKKVTGTTDGTGEIHVHELDPGKCTVTFPGVHGEEWSS